jgi:predicted transcriptional regulator
MNSIESSNESVDFLSIAPQDIADERGWDCYASDTLSQDVEFYTLQDAKLRKGLQEAKQGKFSKTPPKIKPKKKK